VKVHLNVKLEKPIHDFIIELTKILGVTKSEIVRNALINYFKELKESKTYDTLKKFADKSEARC